MSDSPDVRCPLGGRVAIATHIYLSSSQASSMETYLVTGANRGIGAVFLDKVFVREFLREEFVLKSLIQE